MSRADRNWNSIAEYRPDSLLRTLFVAMGFTTLFFMWIISPAVEPRQEAFYHWSGTARSFFLPIALDFLALWLLIALLLLIARSPGRLRVAVWSGLLFFTPWGITQTLHAMNLLPATHLLDLFLLLAGVLPTVLVTLRWRWSCAPTLQRATDTAGTILAFAGLFGFLMLGQLTLRSWQARSVMGTLPLHQRAALTPQPHRIIWIVFDELSYQQTFEHRFPGLPLPAFDAFAATSTNFTQARTFAIRTEFVLPGLFAGQPFDSLKALPITRPSVHNLSTGRWQTFDQHDTVFQDALNDGYSTAVVGWYNPYCRILPAVLDSCYWTYRSPLNRMLPSGPILANMVGPSKSVGWKLLNLVPARTRLYLTKLLHIPTQLVFSTQGHIEDYSDLDARTQAMLRDRSYTFVLLHLPVPHPLGIYDRRTRQFTLAGSSYLNNLALADRCLAGIREVLEQTNQWDSSTVIIMGDHSWRTTQIWHLPKPSYGWASEDDLASRGGQYDPRPAYLIKLPNQTTPARIDTPYATVNTRHLFDNVMTGRITTPADLAAWAHSLPNP